MNITPQAYSQMSREAEPKSNVIANTSLAFLTGGAICATGQIIRSVFETYGFSDESSSLWTSVILVSLSAFFTAMGWYQRVAKYAGAGTLVPITGFSNAISSSAIEAKSEGLILGVGAKIFTIAGPVILYGCTAAFIYGIIYYIFTHL